MVGVYVRGVFFFSLVFVQLLMTSPKLMAASYSLNASNQGWYNSLGEHPMHDNTITGLLGDVEYRSFFVFQVPNECASGVKSASLSVSSSSPSAGLGLTPHNISINGLTLDHSGSIGQTNMSMNIYSDMGTNQLAQVTITNNGDFTFSQPLNQQALVLLEGSAAAHGAFAVALTHLEPVSPQYIMGYSGAGDVVGLLEINCEPVASITVQQVLTNDNNGTATASDFQPQINGQPVVWDVPARYFANTYNLSEVMLVPGYSAGDWGGDCSINGVLELQPGQSAVCTITNDDIPATLTLTHAVVNDSGGTATSADFFAYVNGVFRSWNVNQTVDAGTYSLIVSAVDGYVNSDWQGDCSGDGSITLALGETANCHIVSNDMGVDLIIDKSVNDISPNIGDLVTFSIVVDNLGPDTATNVKVVDVVTSGLEYQSNSISGAAQLTDNDPYTNGLIWVIPTLPVGMPVTLTFQAKVLPP